MSATKFASIEEVLEAQAASLIDAATAAAAIKEFMAAAEERGRIKGAATSCPLTPDQLSALVAGKLAASLPVLIGTDKNAKFSVKAMQFKTGSYGFNITGKATARVGDQDVKIQVSANAVIIGSGKSE